MRRQEMMKKKYFTPITEVAVLGIAHNLLENSYINVGGKGHFDARGTTEASCWDSDEEDTED